MVAQALEGVQGGDMRTDEIENGEGVKELLAACGVTPIRAGGNSKQVELLLNPNLGDPIQSGGFDSIRI